MSEAIYFFLPIFKSLFKYTKNCTFELWSKDMSKAVEAIPLNVDKSYVRKFLGEPIDMGFDYSYLIDSTGANGCTIGAVFHINEANQINQKWIDKICE